MPEPVVDVVDQTIPNNSRMKTISRVSPSETLAEYDSSLLNVIGEYSEENT